jgi:uncharacterized protein (UPF0261 family)
MSVYLLATLDTKGAEARFVRERLAAAGVSTVLVDCGCLGSPADIADIPRQQVYAAAGKSLDELRQKADRGAAIAAAAAGVTRLVHDHYQQGKISGVFALGGSAGTTIGAAAMRALPIGVPKLMVSTLASGQVRHYVGDKDILMLNSIVDISGINRISRTILSTAAAAMAGMVAANVRATPGATGSASASQPDDKPLIAATMFGVTTPCVERAKVVLQDAGYEVLVFHATGSGGQAMESLVSDGLIAGVLDITTTELADELVGGFLTAGPDRLTAAARKGIPQVVSVGATDMVNFHAPETVPEKFKGRKFYQHNPSVTLMRTTPEENSRIGADLGRKLAATTGPVAIYLPKQGVSAIDRIGQPFDDPDARTALFAAVRQNCGQVPVTELDAHINDPQFAETMAKQLLQMLRPAARKP